MRRFILVATIFVVHWTITESHPTSCCSDNDYHQDPYTRQRVSDGCETWALTCYSKPVVTPMEKRFETKKEAQAFIDGAPKGAAGSVVTVGDTTVGGFTLEEVNL